MIEEMSQNLQGCIHHSEKDFTRVCKFSFESLVKFILAMNGKELMDYFDYDVHTLSSSAFIQQRIKIKSEAFK